MYTIENEKETTSEFNGAVDFLTRMNSIFYVIDESRIASNFPLRIKSIETLFYEISTEMTEKEFTQGREVLAKARSELAQYEKKMQNTGNARFSTSIEDELNLLEVALRKIMKRAGLLYKAADTEEDEEYEY